MRKIKGVVTALALAGMLSASLPATAGIVGTEQMVQQEARTHTLNRIDGMLAKEAVAAQLKAWGVAPELVNERVAALSDTELQKLAADMENAPAGGVLVVIGVVFVVLIVLEVIGVTNIFRRV